MYYFLCTSIAAAALKLLPAWIRRKFIEDIDG